MKQKLSDWQSADTRPTIKGVYQIQDDRKIRWCYWHGRFWDASYSTKELAALDKGNPYNSFWQDHSWRGVL